MKLHSFPLDIAEPSGVFSALCAMPYSLWLDSADRGGARGRYSFIAFHPFETIEAKDGRVTVTNKDQQLTLRGDPLTVLQERIDAYGIAVEDDPALPPFTGGAAGFFGYDLARGIERLPASAAAHPHMPDMAVGLYDKVCAFNHETGAAWFLTLAPDGKSAHRNLQYLQHLMAQAPAVPPYRPFTPAWRGWDNAAAYKKKIGRVIDYIHAGDIFQANLSQQFFATLPPGFDAFAHYCHLRAFNPAPFAAYLNMGSLKIASASPERFLWLRGDTVETRPIKGTRPRHDDPARDAQSRAALDASEKDRAENAMIVDLMRNDLSRCCTDDSITVPQLCAVESFTSVHHLVSAVTGRLRPDCTATDLLRACFPGGSITGAPKVRAMEIIEELEPVRRGPYCGAIGYIGFNGAMDTSITIRTLVYDGNSVSFNVGGGIVADSDPESEYQETLDKGRALFNSFTGGIMKKTA